METVPLDWYIYSRTYPCLLIQEVVRQLKRATPLKLFPPPFPKEGDRGGGLIKIYSPSPIKLNFCLFYILMIGEGARGEVKIAGSYIERHIPHRIPEEGVRQREQAYSIFFLAIISREGIHQRKQACYIYILPLLSQRRGNEGVD